MLSHTRSALELLLMTLWILISIWFLRVHDSLQATVVAMGVAALLVICAGHGGDSFRSIAMARNSLAAALKRVACITVPALAVILLASAYLNSAHFPSPQRGLPKLFTLILFGLSQEYILLVFFYRRVLHVVGKNRLAVILVAVLFAIFHTPNTFLMGVTFLAAIGACWVYSGAQNVPVIGVAHGILTFGMYYALPPAITHALEVGPAFFRS